MFTKINQAIRQYFEPSDKSVNGLYLVLYEAIREAIDTGTIPENTLLPPTRLLAEEIGLSRSTVVKAYNLLTENKFLTARQGSGYVVASNPRHTQSALQDKASYPEISEIGQSFLHNIHLLDKTASEGMAFTPGLPPLDVFPIGQWQKLSNMYWRHIKSSDLNYSISSGIDSLKKNIANYLLLSRRIKCDPDQIIIVSGSLQSLYLIGSVLINKGDGVCLENPTFPNVISIFKSLQANVHPIEVDEEGIRVDQLSSEEHKKAKLIHVTPSNHYPTGGKMSMERRLQLLEWANENNAILIENDYEHEINNWHSPVDSLFSLDQQQRTIYLGTFNRILHPSIRLGYMVAPPYLLASVKALQMHSHRFVPQSIQAVMTDFMAKNIIYKHLHNAIDEAQDRKEFFLSLFEKQFDESIQLRPQATSSFHLLAEIADDLSDEKLVAALEAKGIIAHALSKCYIGEEKKQGLILGYSCVNRSFMAPFMSKMAAVHNGKGWQS